MKSVFSFVCLFFCILFTHAQASIIKEPEQVYTDLFYENLKKGKYQVRSEDPSFASSTKTKIDGMILKDTAFLNSSSLMYLATDKPIVLFTKKGNVTSNDIAGVLSTSTLVDVDTIFYDAIYIDAKEAPMSMQQWSDLVSNDGDYYTKYPLTYNVWYAININNKKYYTDHKLHDFIEFTTYIPSKNQILLVCSQSTGYDGVYDLGYPDFYYIVILQKDKDGWKQVYRSDQLDLNDGGSGEYGLSELYPRDIKKKGENIEINFADFFTIIWTGKIVKVEMAEITNDEDFE